MLDGTGWQDAPAVTHLTPDERDRLAEDVGEALFLLAKTTARQATLARTPPDVIDEHAVTGPAERTPWSPRIGGSR